VRLRVVSGTSIPAPVRIGAGWHEAAPDGPRVPGRVPTA
jgi:hypothetical protein